MHSARNTGFSGGHNTVMRESHAPYLLVLNPDVVLASDYCEKLIACLEAHPEAGSAGGRLIRGGDNPLTFSLKNATIDSCGIALYRSHLAANIAEGQPADSMGADKAVWGVSGAAVMYRRAALVDVAEETDGRTDYFDEDFFVYQEDIDLSYRLQWRGWSAWYCAAAIARHERTRKGDTIVEGRGGFAGYMWRKVRQSVLSRRGSPLISYWSYRNHWYLLIKNLSGGVFWECCLWLLPFEYAKMLYRALWEGGFWGEMREVYKNYRRMMTKRRYIMSRRKISSQQMMSLLS